MHIAQAHAKLAAFGKKVLLFGGRHII